MGEIVNKARLSGILGKSERTLTEWQKEGLPVETHGERGQSNTYDTEKVIAWMVTRGSNVAAQTEQANLRLIHAKVRIAEAEAGKQEGNLIPLEVMKAEWSSVLGSFRARMIPLPGSLAPVIATFRGEVKKIERLLKTSIYEALKELAEYDPENNRKAKRGGKAGDKRSSAAAGPNSL